MRASDVWIPPAQLARQAQTGDGDRTREELALRELLQAEESRAPPAPLERDAHLGIGEFEEWERRY